MYLEETVQLVSVHACSD